MDWWAIVALVIPGNSDRDHPITPVNYGSAKSCDRSISHMVAKAVKYPESVLMDLGLETQFGSEYPP